MIWKMTWWPWTLAAILGVAALAALSLYAKSKKRGYPLLACGLLLAAASIGVAVFLTAGVRRNRALFDACTAGDAKAADEALAEGADAGAADATGLTPLMYAARGDHPNQGDPGATDHAEVVQLLLDRRADVNAATDSGFVALFWAARYGHEIVVQVLIDKGADVNAKDKDGMTALKWATTNRPASPAHYDQVIALLKKAGAKE